MAMGKDDLVSVADLLDNKSAFKDGYEIFHRVAEWCDDYLCNTHPNIGKDSVVCPWTPVGIKNKIIWLIGLATKNRDRTSVLQDIHSMIELFKKQEPCDGIKTQFKSILIIFQDLEDGGKVEDFQRAMKPDFLDAGLMLGEFYPTCKSPGLRNSNFYPLQSPVPMLVVREMLETDIVFLKDSKKYIDAYLKYHDDKGVNEIKIILDNHRDMLNQPQLELLKEAMDE